MSEYEPSAPFARATISSGAVTLNHWNPTLIGLGPRNRLLDDLGDHIVIADLTIERRDDGNELVVGLITGDLNGGPLARFIRWGRDAGYRRAWLSDRVIGLESEEVATGTSSACCPTCGITWRDSSPGFLVEVRRSGFFPPSCLACGGSLPEWEIDRASTNEALAFCPAGTQNEDPDFAAS